MGLLHISHSLSQSIKTNRIRFLISNFSYLGTTISQAMVSKFKYMIVVVGGRE